MPNSYFQFKKFRIEQGETAMKVTTEACLFGAISEKLAQPEKLTRILDIGAGTGLLSLMKAQHTTQEISIDAVELDQSAFLQAQANFKNSPWSDQLNAIQGDINKFSSTHQYDLILSNPPFFKDHFQSENRLKNQALHTTTLRFEDLATAISKLIQPNGTAHILLPPQPMEYFSQLMLENGFYPTEKISVYNLPNKPLFRVIASFTKLNSQPKESSILIRNEMNEYSPEFVELLRPYYLHL